MVRIDVTLNVTLTDDCLVTRQNETRQRLRIQSNMRQRHPMMQMCGRFVPLWRSRPACVSSAVMAGSMPGVTASTASGTDDTRPGS